LPAVTGRQKRGVPSWEFFADREEFDRLCHKAKTWRGVEPWWDTCGIGLALPVQEMLLAFSNYPRSAASAIFTIPVALIAKEDRPGAHGVNALSGLHEYGRGFPRRYGSRALSV
jgi:hypothetical protein